MISLVVGIAAFLLLLAILIRFWRRPAQQVAEPVVSDDDQQPQPPEPRE
jgi:hypothetical protein